MTRLAVIALAVAGLIIAAYILLRTKPAFDLDGFSTMVGRLQAGHRVARRVADTDAIPAWMHTDREHLAAVGRILSAHDGDCARTVAALEAQLNSYRQQQAEDEGRLDLDDLASLPPAQRNQVGQKLLFVLAPAYAALKDPVRDWAWQCKEESQVLEEILGTLAAD